MKIKNIVSIGLSIVFFLCYSGNFKINIAAANENIDYYVTLDSESDEYKGWKSKIVDSSNNNKITKFALKKSSNGIRNNYLSLNFYNDKFTLGTIDGDPNSTTDNNQKLLYGYPNSGTSYTTVRIDGNDYTFQPII